MAGGRDAQVVGSQVDAVGFAEEGQVEVVVDDEEGAGFAGQLANAPCQREEVAPAQLLVSELDDVGATAEGGGGNRDQAIGLQIGGDDVEAGGKQAVAELVWRGPVNLPNGPTGAV